MKRRFFLFLTLIPILCGVAGCAGINYSDRDNWVIRETEKPGSTYDLFYVYPTLFSSPEQPYMEWRGAPEVARKTTGFVKAQTAIFGPEARIFAPYVRQLEYTRCIRELEKQRTPKGSERGIRDTCDAFRSYLKKWNRGRPFVLVGHSQGAVDLYEMLKRMPEITRSRGFVAAYLPGLPHKTKSTIERDFAGRDIAPARNASDTGVIIVWNTQNRKAKNRCFTGTGNYCINPLNWKTDATPAGKKQNAGAVFYDYRHPERPLKRIAHFCGATVDPAKGALIVELPSKSEYDAHGFMGKGVFHMNDFWFFAENCRKNALQRVKSKLQGR